ncbi:hypothetical protein VNO77_04329 [Canavalia gladiata]|uniref:Uncharacterized protein n=1 Tax=Canavalia gladiata TaxID=3824 RepID=A0AAN9MX58_CANGL
MIALENPIVRRPYLVLRLYSRVNLCKPGSVLWSLFARYTLDMATTSGIVNRHDGCEEQDWSATSAILESHAHIRGGDSIIHEDHAYCSARDHVSFSTSPRAGFVHGTRALRLHYQRHPIVPSLLPSFRRSLCFQYMQKVVQNYAHQWNRVRVLPMANFSFNVASACAPHVLASRLSRLSHSQVPFKPPSHRASSSHSQAQAA